MLKNIQKIDKEREGMLVLSEVVVLKYKMYVALPRDAMQSYIYVYILVYSYRKCEFMPDVQILMPNNLICKMCASYEAIITKKMRLRHFSFALLMYNFKIKML